MTASFKVPAETDKRQSQASHPAMSAWVSANAGSGKTHVLAQRVIRLLLAGTDPSRVLCLTYTRAAAANMANRVFDELSAWTRMDDAALGQVIGGLTGKRPSADDLRRGRRLFARALETPGGLKIQTIHAFCEAVLHQFPLEANIAGHFEMLDGRMEAALFAEARRGMLVAAYRNAGSSAATALSGVLDRAGEFGLDTLLVEVVAKRDELRDFIAQMRSAPEPFSPLFERFEFMSGETELGIAASLWPLEYFTAAFADEFERRAVSAGKQRALEFAQSLQSALSQTDPLVRLDHLAKTFLTAQRAGAWKPRATRTIAAKGVGEYFPEFAEQFEQAADRICGCLDRLALFRMLDSTRAALILAEQLIERYERLKSARGFLDFNDLIGRTIRLLGRGDVGPWIHYKLDRGIEHILVDEAQDTSPQQWAIINSLAAEFFSGQGLRQEGTRTIFAVGDEKQSIYSFQGAAPEAFDASGRSFRRKAEGAGLDFQPVELYLSFRSTPDILSAVDRVFEHEHAYRGLHQQPRKTVHEAIRRSDSGYVDIWSSIGQTDVDQPEDWTEPVDHASAPAVQLAERIATRIENWIASGEIIEGRGRALAAGDVMVLVRKRDRFIHALSRSLKNRHIAVAGADRLNLAGHIAVQDLVALGRFVLQPEDDLSLAALLKSPVFDLSEDQLFELAWNRPQGVSLFEALRQTADRDQDLQDIERQLAQWRAQADFRPVFEFYADILASNGVREKMVGRLGREAGDVLDEFLRFAFAEEQSGLPGLEVFLATLEMAGPDVKRESDQTRDEVRIMTVHAAKGLESPVVFLVDNGSAPFSPSHLPRLLVLPTNSDQWQGNGYLWRGGRDVENSVSHGLAAGVRGKAEEEYRRLLYVGMTRAEDRLITCGYHGKRPPAEDGWLALVQNALLPFAMPLQDGPDGIAAHRYQISDPAAKSGERPIAEPEPAPLPEYPVDLLTPVPAVQDLPPPLSPSGAGAAIEPDADVVSSTRSPVFDQPDRPSFAIERGLAIHRLLQVLPSLPESERRPAAERYIARAGANWQQAERLRAVESSMAVLQESDFADVFGTGSQAEVSIMGTLQVGDGDRSISGKIDRLAVSADQVLIVDYKTNRPPAGSAGDVPFSYVAQMALYRALLAEIYPGRRIRAALLYSETPRLIELPPSDLDDALARVTRA